MAGHRVLCVQNEPRFGAVSENLDAVEALLQGRAAELIVLPELFATGYAFASRQECVALSEPVPGGTTLARLAAWSRSSGALVVAGFAEREGDRVYNAAAAVSPDGRLTVYRKLHLFGFEREVFDPGDAPPPVVEHRGLRVGVMICFDWIFPETARLLALAGADVIAHPSNLVLPFCQQAMPVRALENGVYAVTANRVGTEVRPPRPSLTFTGHSVVVGPRAEVLAKAPERGAAVLAATVDPVRARDKRLASGNNPFTERRTEHYGALVRPVPRPAAPPPSQPSVDA